MKIYCQKCGSPTDYISQKPKFCCNCGVSFSGDVKASVRKKRPIQRQAVEEEYEEEYESPDAEFILDNLSSLDVDIDLGQDQGIKFGEALGANSGQSFGDLDRGPDPIAGASASEIKNNLKSEAGSLKGKPKKRTRKTRNNGKSKT